MTAKDIALEALRGSAKALTYNELAQVAGMKENSTAKTLSVLYGMGAIKAKVTYMGDGVAKRIYYVRPEQIAGLPGLRDTAPRKQRKRKSPPVTPPAPVEMLISMPVGNGTIQVTYDEGRALFDALKRIYEPGSK